MNATICYHFCETIQNSCNSFLRNGSSNDTDGCSVAGVDCTFAALKDGLRTLGRRISTACNKDEKCLSEITMLEPRRLLLENSKNILCALRPL